MKPGDTLFSIAYKHNIPSRLLKSLNPKVMTDCTLFKGDVILVPRKVLFDQNLERTEQELCDVTQETSPNGLSVDA